MSEKFQIGDRVRVIRKNDELLQCFGLCGKVIDTATLDRTSRPVCVTIDDKSNVWFKDNELQFEHEIVIKQSRAKAARISLSDRPDLIGPLPPGQTRPPPCCLVL